ncbi:MAG: M48 family metalloprotease [bacterium]|nr:M48 family metalloprotease [bacterium]
MIYTNFLFFIVAIAIFSMAPSVGTESMKFPLNLYGVLLLFLVFWQFNRYKFLKIRRSLDNQETSIGEVQRHYLSTINKHIAFAVFLFAMEVYFFDLKELLVQIPKLGQLQFFINGFGVTIFILHLVAVWYWAYKAMGDVVEIGKTPESYIFGHVKFNLAIIFPWLLFMGSQDVFDMGTMSLSLQVGLFILFMILIAVIAPVFIVRLWDCKPMEDSELKRDIQAYCQSQGVRFKEIMSWNALNQSLVTAGVIGLTYPFRYLMITPELMRMLSRDEMMAVVSHEVGHVKKKHLVYYLVLFLGLVMLGIASELLLGFFINTSGRGIFNATGLGFFRIFMTLVLFIVYFRFVFGYYIRNFERQADIYCFESGIDPNHMMNSFRRLGDHMGDDGKKPNWHHYNIPQRVGFIAKCLERPEKLALHDRKVKRSVKGLIGVMALCVVLMFMPNGVLESTESLNYVYTEYEVLQRIRDDPNNPALHSFLGMLSYEMKKWEQSKTSFETSLKLNYNQPEALNNLAWLYLKCPDEEFLNHQRALELVRDAVRMQQAAHIFDTLAEACFQNAMYEKAYRASQQAMTMAKTNLSYYKEQLEKMGKYYSKFKSTIKI